MDQYHGNFYTLPTHSPNSFKIRWWNTSSIHIPASIRRSSSRRTEEITPRSRASIRTPIVPVTLVFLCRSFQPLIIGSSLLQRAETVDAENEVPQRGVDHIASKYRVLSETCPVATATPTETVHHDEPRRPAGSNFRTTEECCG